MKLIEVDGHEYFVVGARRWMVADSFREDHELGYKDLTYDGWMRARGCLVKFETGWAVSIIWGNFTYSSNRSYHLLGNTPPWSEEPTSVEIMVLNHRSEPATDDPGHPEAGHIESVLGWVTDDEVINLLDILSDLPTNATFSYDMIRRNE